MNAYYNEIDPQAAAWLRELIKQAHIADGVVDERSIEDITPDELSGFTQCHFFAGIGVWSYALRQAGWSDDRPVWTGSCPCQSFSAAGKGTGFADERHLWPAWFHLIEQCKPPVIFGEQVEAAVKYGWLDLVQADLEGSGYACGAVAAPAAGFGAPHIRARLYFAAQRLAAASGERWNGRDDTAWAGRRDGAQERGNADRLAGAMPAGWVERRPGARSGSPAGRGGAGELGDAIGARLERHAGHGDDGSEPGRVGAIANGHAATAGRIGTLALPDSWECNRLASGEGCERDREETGWQQVDGEPQRGGETDRPGPVNGFWRDADWLYCRDDKWRPVEPGLEPLAHGASGRVGRLRAYGNAIVAPAAQAFIEEFMSL